MMRLLKVFFPATLDSSTIPIMPLIDSTLATLRADIAAGPHELFVVLTSATSETSGKPWCPYCVLAEPAIQRVFGDGDKCESSRLLVSVAQLPLSPADPQTL
jgi:hypothetical protein